MGQKVNPIGFRVTVNKNWDSRWFTKKANFGNWLHEDLKIREFIKGKYYNAAIARIMIERSANRIRIIIYTARPGLLIGPKGAALKREHRIKTMSAAAKRRLAGLGEKKP